MDQHHYRLHRQSHASSSAATAYHSFNDEIELFEPASPPRTDSDDHSSGANTPRSSSQRRDKHSSHYHQPGRHGQGNSSEAGHSSRPSTAVKMQRQDSGYESYTTSPRTSVSSSHRPSVPRRISSNSVTKASMGIHPPSSSSSSSSSRYTIRPSTRRSAKSYTHAPEPLYIVPSSGYFSSPSSQNLHPSRPSSTHQGRAGPASSSSYFQFPSPEPDHHDPAQDLPRSHHCDGQGLSTPTLPPQTTHYWTSDRTRRLEYAAIDAASRGVKGWIRRNLVPDCFLPRDNRQHLAFDDDSGSVRRYRLDLEEEESSGSPCAMSTVGGDGLAKSTRKKTWPFSS